MQDLLSCFDETSDDALEALVAAVACVESEGPHAASCRPAQESCACDAGPAVNSVHEAACLQAVDGCQLDGPCGRAACLQAAAPTARAQMQSLYGCMEAGCGHCEDFPCTVVCLEQQCADELTTCLTGVCPGAKAASGDQNCAQGHACMSTCPGDKKCCFSDCHASMTPDASKALTAWVSCALQACNCLSDGDMGPCLTSCAACSEPMKACLEP